MDIKIFTSAISQIAEEKGISKEKIFETIEQAYAAAYKKDYGKRGQIIKAKLDQKSGRVKFWQVKLVVDDSMVFSEEELEELKTAKTIKSGNRARGINETKELEAKVRFNPERHIMLEQAKEASSEIEIGQDLEIPLEAKKDYGRIAAQTAKQVILQKIREAEREAIFSEYKGKEGEIVSGVVQRVEPGRVYFDIGKALGVLVREEQIPNEFYRLGQRLKLYILKVEETSKGPVIFLSRAYPKLVSRLFELEVPEISQEQVEIKSIAREPGSRTKIAVFSKEEGIDPIGSAVGQRGTRVTAVINELAGEKIDIIEYSDDPEKYIANSLSPAKVVEIKILPKNKAKAFVPHDQLSLAIGKEGQNVRLAAKLTGWKIDVRSHEAPEQDKEVGAAEQETQDEPKNKEQLEKPKKPKKPKKQEKLEKSEKKETKKNKVE